MVRVFLILLIFLAPQIGGQKCAPKIYEYGQVCVCNSTFCDKIEAVGKIPNGKVLVYRSSQDGDRMERFYLDVEEDFGFLGHVEESTTILVDASRQYQKIIGFGGAFTDAAGDNLVALDAATRDAILVAYFDRDGGIEYNLGRVPIASCDFSSREYSYDDVDGDFDLKAFQLTKEDFELKIPFILRAAHLSNSTLQLFASPWSAPAWMKATRKMRGGGSLRDSPHIHRTYAHYFRRFIEEYRQRGVAFWALTIQNEPVTGAATTWQWQGMNYTSETMRDFLRDHLGPVLRAYNSTKHLKIMILDDGRGLLPEWADTIFGDWKAERFADGIAVHWYGNSPDTAKLLDETNRKHPTKFILGTEACAGYYGRPRGPKLGDWERAEQYAFDIITDLNHWVTGWTDWNLVVDETGGPNWVFNMVDAPIIVNRTAGEFYKQPMFYAIAHFSKFFARDSRRIDTRIIGESLLSATSVVCRGGRRATVVMNRGDVRVATRIVDMTRRVAITIDIAPRSIHTILWEKQT